MGARRVLVVTPSLGSGGAERHSVWLATGVDPRRWEPHVVALTGGPLEKELSDAGIPVSVLDLPGLRNTRRASAQIEAALRRIEPDLVTGQNVAVDLALRPALHRNPVPYLAWKHTYGHIGHRGLRERLHERATGSVVTRYGAVCHTQVRYLTDDLGLPASKVSVVANAVPLPESATPTGAGATVLMAAAMRRDKDHAGVLTAWRDVVTAVPQARLLLAGDGPCRPDLERLAGRLGLGGSVEFLGLRDDVAVLLERSTLAVLASYSVECFPYAVLEAMAHGRGVVSTSVGGLPEMVDDHVTGRLVPPHDPAALAAALVEGLSDDARLARAWGAQGVERSQAVFSFADWRSHVDDLYHQVAGQSPGPKDSQQR